MFGFIHRVRDLFHREQEPTVCDGRGRKYSVLLVDDDETGCRMEFHRKNCRAGYANFLKRGGDLFIGDIHLEPEHRGKELGKNAIAYIRGFATQRGFNRLTGKVKHSDYKERPWLPDYYRKHGFTVTDCNDGSAVVEICMELT